jgi:hypothetical protein
MNGIPVVSERTIVPLVPPKSSIEISQISPDTELDLDIAAVQLRAETVTSVLENILREQFLNHHWSAES